MSNRSGWRRLNHGWSGTDEYRAYQAMRARCTCPSQRSYADYGARGIDVCDGWSSNVGFMDFVSTIGRGPSKRHSIDRMDNDRGYHCGHCGQCVRLARTLNVHWATPLAQARNKRNNRQITHNGKTKTLIEWSRLCGRSHRMIGRRLDRGISVEDALFGEPEMEADPISVTINGETKRLSEWCDTLGLSRPAIYRRVRLGGKSPEEALSQPVREREEPIEYGGERMSLHRWSEKLGTPYITMYQRRRKGWPTRDILFGRPKT